MAGYIIYSLDWDKFQKLVNNPSREQLLALAESISDGLDQGDDEFEADDPMRDWPSEPEELTELIKERLARSDWYGDLSDTGKEIWSNAVWHFCCHAHPKEVGFRVDHDGVYWDVIELARKHLNVPPNQVSPDVALSAFGACPYRYTATANEPDDFYAWHPMHSMHAPDEVRRMIEELKSAGAAIEEAGDRDALNDYDALLPVLEKLDKENRLLFIQVDT